MWGVSFVLAQGREITACVFQGRCLAEGTKLGPLELKRVRLTSKLSVR